MARTPGLIWLVSAALFVAACGGGDDASPDPESSTAGATKPTDDPVGEEAAPDEGAAVDEALASDEAPASDEASTGGDESGVALGPALAPTATFEAPASAQPSQDRIAVSPTGDRVAVMWIAEDDFATNLAVYDAATGAELAAIADDRLDGDLFWTSDDRIITADNFGVIWAWDSATLDALSEEPLSNGEADCSGGNGTVFDPVGGALFLQSDTICRIDVMTGEATRFESDNSSSLLAVTIGGNEIYLRTTDASGGLVLQVLDATTLSVISEETPAGPNPVLAASGNGLIEQEASGFGYLVQPSGRAVDFYTSGITTSAGGGYYVSGFDGGTVVISSSDGSTIGTIGTEGAAVLGTAWSADDTVLAARTDDGVSVYAIG
jgi:hypothetical protein